MKHFVPPHTEVLHQCWIVKFINTFRITIANISLRYCQIAIGIQYKIPFHHPAPPPPDI